MGRVNCIVHCVLLCVCVFGCTKKKSVQATSVTSGTSKSLTAVTGTRAKYETEEALVKELVASLKDGQRFNALYPTADLMGTVLKCRGVNPIMQDIAKRKENVLKNTTKFKKRFGEATVKLKKWVKKRSEMLAQGQKKGRCVALKPVTIQEVKATIVVTLPSGKEKTKNDSMRLVKLGAHGWFLARL